MKTIGPHKTPNAGTFQIAYGEVPKQDSKLVVLLYHVTAPSGQVFKIALVALKSFNHDVASAVALMESDGRRTRSSQGPSRFDGRRGLGD